MKNSRTTYISYLYCTECGGEFPLPRKTFAKRERNHIKDLWCYKCKKVTKFVENKSGD